MTHQISHLFGCDRVCIMKDGHIESCDQPENLRSKLTEMETGEKSEESTEEEESSEDKIIEERRQTVNEKAFRKPSISEVLSSFN